MRLPCLLLAAAFRPANAFRSVQPQAGRPLAFRTAYRPPLHAASDRVDGSSSADALPETDSSATTATVVRNDRDAVDEEDAGNASAAQAETADSREGQEVTAAKINAEQLFLQGAEFIEFSMSDHRPLGCTVEETLADVRVPHVFISKIVPGGAADKAGLKVGDVVVGVTGPFRKVVQVAGLGVDKVKGLVGALPDNVPLDVIVARGSDVMAKHEQALVDICSSGGSDKEVEKSLTNFLASGYDPVDDSSDTSGTECMEEDTECLIDNMFDLWAEELPPQTSSLSGIADATAGGRTDAAPVKPWSSRSSPSGTWVRDPRTGEMRNIDA